MRQVSLQRTESAAQRRKFHFGSRTRPQNRGPAAPLALLGEKGEAGIRQPHVCPAPDVSLKP